MADTAWLVDGVQVKETTERNWFVDGVQVTETTADAPPSGLIIPIAMHHLTKNITAA